MLELYLLDGDCMKSISLFALFIIFANANSMDLPIGKNLDHLLALSNNAFDKKLHSEPQLINAQDEQGKTLLIKAIEQGNLIKAKKLLGLNADAFVADKSGKTALDYVNDNENMEFARLFILKRMDDVAKWDRNYSYEKYKNAKDTLFNLFRDFELENDPFIKSIFLGDLESIRKEISKSPNIVNETRKKRNLLYIIASRSNEATLRFFLELGLPVIDRPDLKNLPESKRKLFYEFGSPSYKLKSTFFNAIANGNIQEFTSLLKSNPELAFQTLYGEEPLRKAIEKKRLEMVKLLRAARVDFKDETGDEKPLIYIAALNNDAPMIRYLGSIRVVVQDYLESDDYWPFNHPLSEEVKKELYRIWDDRIGTDIQIALNNAIVYKRQEYIDYTLSKGATINGFNKEGDTILTFLATNGNAEQIANLLNLGASPNIRDKNKGRTPLRWLLRMHEKSKEKSEESKKLTTSELLPCFFLLMCAGADPALKDTWGESVIDWINKQGFSKEENELIDRILAINKTTSKEELKNILLSIYLFQKKEIDKINKNRTPIDYSKPLRNQLKAGAIYRNLVAKEVPIKGDLYAKKIVFNDIYKKYIE